MKIVKMQEEPKNCILEAKKEYTKLLVLSLYPMVYQGIKSIWEDSKKSATPRKVYEDFQNRLTRVRKWNQDIIDQEHKRIIEKLKANVDWNLDDLIKQVFVLHTQILASINLDNSKKIKVKIPQGAKFIHCVYKETARSFFENPLLLEDRPFTTISRVDMSKNLQKANKLITLCIENTITNLLPVDGLLKDNYNSDSEGETVPAIPDTFKISSSSFGHNGGGDIIKNDIKVTAPVEIPEIPEIPIIPSLEPSGPTEKTIYLNKPYEESAEQPTISNIESVPIVESIVQSTVEELPKTFLDLKESLFPNLPETKDLKSEDSTILNDVSFPVPVTKKTDLAIDLNVLSLNDSTPYIPTTSPPELPTLDNFDPVYFSDAEE
jgi:hypothetical protein